MKKFLKGLGIFFGVIVVLVACVFIFRSEIIKILEPRITKDMYVNEVPEDFDPGIPVGNTLPSINAIFEGEVIDNIEQFAGENGTFFMINRSADWCPFCRRQFADFQEHLADFEAAGIGVVALTYDTPEKQQPLIDAVPLTYPFLSDIESSTIIDLGILNEDYEPGSRAYGVADPGAFILDSNGVIAGKIFVDGHQNRVTADASLTYAKLVLGL